LCQTDRQEARGSRQAGTRPLPNSPPREGSELLSRVACCLLPLACLRACYRRLRPGLLDCGILRVAARGVHQAAARGAEVLPGEASSGREHGDRSQRPWYPASSSQAEGELMYGYGLVGLIVTVILVILLLRLIGIV
jgi:hypothetical protein